MLHNFKRALIGGILGGSAILIVYSAIEILDKIFSIDTTPIDNEDLVQGIGYGATIGAICAVTMVHSEQEILQLL